MDRLLQLGADGLSGMGQVLLNRERVLYPTPFNAHHTLQPPPGMAGPMMDTAEIVYISSLALLKVFNIYQYH